MPQELDERAHGWRDVRGARIDSIDIADIPGELPTPVCHKGDELLGSKYGAIDQLPSKPSPMPPSTTSRSPSELFVLKVPFTGTASVSPTFVQDQVLLTV